MKPLTISLTLALLIVSGSMQAGLLQTVAEMPGKAVEATATVAKDVVTAPEDLVEDTVTAPARVVGTVPMKEKQVVKPEAKPAKSLEPEDFVVEETDVIVEPANEPVE